MTDTPNPRPLREVLSQADHYWRALDVHARCVLDVTTKMWDLIDPDNIEPITTVRGREAHGKVAAVTGALLTDADSLMCTLDSARRRIDNLRFALLSQTNP